MREVRIRDTLSGELKSLDPDAEVGIYACGPTVYSRIHIGNARPFVVFSLLARFLKSEGYRTKLVVNVTDINDKIYDAAKVAGESSASFAEKMTHAYFEDTDRLGLGRPDAEPLATETIGGIVALIGDLVESGHAYESGGDVYFRVRGFGGYGKLSNRRAEDMDQGEEAGSASLKEDSLDFALWKARKEGEDTSWDSPWGPGRPGWHIECSAMAEAELGSSFAIHGGGSDLVFPHHENEIAQSEAAGRPFARIWMHNGMVETAAEKMSKSEGNIFQLSEALDRYGREAVVAYLISGHYRQPLAFGAEQMEQAAAGVERLRNFFREHPVGALGTGHEGRESGGPPPGTGQGRRESGGPPPGTGQGRRESGGPPPGTGQGRRESGGPPPGTGQGGREPGGSPPGTRVETSGEGPCLAGSQVPIGEPPGSRLIAFHDALADDFNTPRAMAEVFELVAEANREVVPGAPEAVREMLELVGLESLAEAEQGGGAEAEALLAEREQARAVKDFARADEIRDRLAELGWEVRDGAGGAKLVPRGRA